MEDQPLLFPTAPAAPALPAGAAVEEEFDRRLIERGRAALDRAPPGVLVAEASRAVARVEARNARLRAEAEADARAAAARRWTLGAVMAETGMGGDSFAGWRAVAAMIDGESEYSARDRDFLTGLLADQPPVARPRELWLLAGRRAGKTKFSGAVAVAWALRPYPAIEHPEVLLVAKNTVQARHVAAYVRQIGEQLGVVAGGSKEVLPVAGGATIRVVPNTSSVRGSTAVAVILDEASYYESAPGAAWSDRDLYDAVKPALANARNGLIMVTTTPWKQQGIVYDAWSRWNDGERGGGRIVMRAPTRALNPTISQELIDEQAEVNSGILAEYGAEFFVSGGSFLPPALLTDEKFAEWPKANEPGPEMFAFVDMAGGGGADSFALATARRDRLAAGGREAHLVDLYHRAPPFKVGRVVGEAAMILKRRGIDVVVGDRFGDRFAVEEWRRHGVTYVQSKRSRSQIYHAFAPHFIKETPISLLRDKRLVSELRTLIELESREPPSKVDHQPGCHDDLANAAAGALVLAMDKPARAETWVV